MWTHLRIYQPINQATPNHCYKLFKLFKTYQIGLNKKLKIFNKPEGLNLHRILLTKVWRSIFICCSPNVHIHMDIRNYMYLRCVYVHFLCNFILMQYAPLLVPCVNDYSNPFIHTYKLYLSGRGVY